MKRLEWIVCCAIAAGFLGQSGVAEAQFGGEAGGVKNASKGNGSSEDAAAAPLMRGSEYDSAQAPSEVCRCTGEGIAAKIRQALAQPLVSAGLDFSETPLQEIASQLQEDYGIPVQLDLAALDNAGIGPDEPVTVNIRNVSLKSALRLMLQRLQMTYVIRDEVLILTTPEEAEAQLQACVYDVGDLIGAKGQSLDPLIDVIVSCVYTDTWSENGGGEAEIRPLPPRFLVISQTHAVHEEIGDLLKTIRAMRGDSQATSVPATTFLEPEPELATPFEGPEPQLAPPLEGPEPELSTPFEE